MTIYLIFFGRFPNEMYNVCVAAYSCERQHYNIYVHISFAWEMEYGVSNGYLWGGEVLQRTKRMGQIDIIPMCVTVRLSGCEQNSEERRNERSKKKIGQRPLRFIPSINGAGGWDFHILFGPLFFLFGYSVWNTWQTIATRGSNRRLHGRTPPLWKSPLRIKKWPSD